MGKPEVKVKQMGNRNHKHGADEAIGDFDRALDGALAKYAEIEPRAGLEERVLANLQIERPTADVRAWWRWPSAVGLAAIVLVVLALPYAWRTPKPLPLQAHVATPTQSNPPKRDVPSRQIPLDAQTASRRARSVPRASVAAVQPKRAQFPSPEPLSEQEKILADYVVRFQEQAVLIARFNEEDLRRDRVELVGNPPGGAGTGDLDNGETKVR